MKVTPIDIIKDMSGKVCQHSDTYVSLNRSSGKMYTGKRCHPYTGPASAKQLTQQQAFKLRAEKATAWLLANRPSATNGERGTADYQLAQRLKMQLQLSNVRQVVCKYMDDSGKVSLPAISSGSTSGGGSTSGSGSTSGGGSSTETGGNTGGGSTPSGGGSSTETGGNTGGGSTPSGGNTGGDL